MEEEYFSNRLNDTLKRLEERHMSFEGVQNNRNQDDLTFGQETSECMSIEQDSIDQADIDAEFEFWDDRNHC